MVAFDLLELCWERRKEPNLPHISIADHTGKKKIQPPKSTFFSTDGAKVLKKHKLLMEKTAQSKAAKPDRKFAS